MIRSGCQVSFKAYSHSSIFIKYHLYYSTYLLYTLLRMNVMLGFICTDSVGLRGSRSKQKCKMKILKVYVPIGIRTNSLSIHSRTPQTLRPSNIPTKLCLKVIFIHILYPIYMNPTHDRVEKLVKSYLSIASILVKLCMSFNEI